jgi:hypothetical protein
MTRMSQVSLSSVVATSNQPRHRGVNGSNSSSSLSSRYFFMAAIVLLGLLVMVFVQSPSSSAATTKQQQHGDTTNLLSVSEASSARSLVPNEIVKGEWNGEAYYHCPANINNASTTNKKVQDIILWHGAAYTKEEWKTSGILQTLCNVDHFSVTALDLSHRSNHQALVELLHGLQNDQKLLSLPLAAIVTPSASGFGVVDWINQDIVDFVQSIHLWVPVACPAVTNLDANKMEQLKNDNFPILAIHGDQDAPGKQRSSLLHDKIGADVVQLKGHHPCYLDSPDAFVETLMKRLENERLKNSQE